MELRATKDIKIGEDVTPSIAPLAYSLHRHFISTRCSSCFRKLPVTAAHLDARRSSYTTNHVCPRLQGCPVRYCSVECLSADVITHVSSGDCRLLSMRIDNDDLLTSLRLASRILFVLKNCRDISTDRFVGLLAGKDKIEKNKKALKLLHMAREREHSCSNDCEKWKEAIALCAVMRNQTQVSPTDEIVSVGAAVYPLGFSWINHSCSPNTWYRFELFRDFHVTPFGEDPSMIKLWGINHLSFVNGLNLRAPRVILRSIRHIKQGDEISISYIDNRLPKGRRRCLLKQYGFVCKCKRCRVHKLDAAEIEFEKSIRLDLEVIDRFILKRVSSYSGTIYMDCLNILIRSLLNPDSNICLDENCSLPKKQRDRLNKKIDKLLDEIGYRKLHPVHYVMRHLFSLYLKFHPDSGDKKVKAAFRCVMATALHHIFMSEPSIITYVAHSWHMFGLALEEVYLELAPRNGQKRQEVQEECCGKCNNNFLCTGGCQHLLSIRSPSNEGEFQITCTVIWMCIREIMRHVWLDLSNGIDCLKTIRDPTDFAFCVGAEGPFTCSISLKDFLGRLSMGYESRTVQMVRNKLAANDLI